jgi:hypothetical protein
MWLEFGVARYLSLGRVHDGSAGVGLNYKINTTNGLVRMPSSLNASIGFISVIHGSFEMIG